MSHRSHAGLHARRLFDVVLTATIFGLVWLLPPAAQAANPAEEMFKGGRTFIDGGVDPHGDSWRSMAHSLEQFLHPEFMLRLFLSLTLAIACSWIVAWHPRSTRLASLSDLEERKTLILLGMVGAVVAELSGTSQTLAFVILRHWRVAALPHRARQSEAYGKGHYRRYRWTRVRNGILGHGGVRHHFQLDPDLLA